MLFLLPYSIAVPGNENIKLCFVKKIVTSIKSNSPTPLLTTLSPGEDDISEMDQLSLTLQLSRLLGEEITTKLI